MKLHWLSIFSVFVLGVFIGCSQKTPDIAVPVVAQPPGPPDYKNRRIAPEKHLPTAASNIQLYNNYWTYFELECGGKNRKFLMHHSHPKDDWQGRESLVELKD